MTPAWLAGREHGAGPPRPSPLCHCHGSPPDPPGPAVCSLLTSLLVFTLVIPLKWRSPDWGPDVSMSAAFLSASDATSMGRAHY